MTARLCDVVVRRRWAHAPVIHAASHFYHEKRAAWASISMHTCDPVPIVMELRLAALRIGPPELRYEGKAKKSVFPQNFANARRTTTTGHMSSFIDFYFHFLANFRT